MTSSQQFGYRFNHPGTLIAAVPAVLGFVPEQSLVLVTVERGGLGAVLRVDLSDGLAASIDDLARVAAAAAPDAAIAVIVDECGADCEPCNDAHRELVARLDTALAERGIDLLDAHVVDRVAAGGRWHSVDGCGAAGPSTTRPRHRWRPRRCSTADGCTAAAPSSRRCSTPTRPAGRPCST